MASSSQPALTPPSQSPSSIPPVLNNLLFTGLADLLNEAKKQKVLKAPYGRKKIVSVEEVDRRIGFSEDGEGFIVDDDEEEGGDEDDEEEEDVESENDEEEKKNEVNEGDANNEDEEIKFSYEYGFNPLIHLATYLKSNNPNKKV